MKAWEQFLVQQEAELGKETVSKWLRPLKIAGFDACNLYLEAQDLFQIQWFEEHLRCKVSTALVNNNRKPIKVHINVAAHSLETNRTQQKREKIPPPAPPTVRGECSFDPLDPHQRFDNFVLAPANELVYKILANLPVDNELNFNPIYIYGNGGVGKTHLLMAATQHLKNQGFRVIYARADTFTTHVVTAIRSGDMNSVRHAYRNVDALLIDDVHAFARKTTTQEEFFHTFNTLHVAGKQIILSANCPPQELAFVEPRLISRFEWGIVLPIEPLDIDQQVMMLRTKAQSLNVELTPRMTEFLLKNFTSGTKSLMRALHALILRCHMDKAFAVTSPSALTIPQMKQLLYDLLSEELQVSLTPHKVIQHVAEHFGILSTDILGKSQSRDCALPRQISMYLCRHDLKLTYGKIGELFNKDHSTAISSVKVIQQHLDDNDCDVTTAIAAIQKKLKASPILSEATPYIQLVSDQVIC